MNAVWVVARLTFRECTRRRIFLIVPLVALAFLALFALGAHFAFNTVERAGDAGRGLVDAQALVGATLVGLSVFVTLFLGSSLGIFLTFGTVRGDGEQGILQQMVVRPVARGGYLAGRFVGAVAVCAVYELAMYLGAVIVVGAIGGWWPDPFLLPAAHLAGAVTIVIALSLLGSIFLPAMSNGIVIFMLYGAGLLAGLLGQLGDAIASPGLERTGHVIAWALPFEALYQSALDSLTSASSGLTRVIVELGPLGGAQPGGPLLVTWSALYLVAVGAAALFAFSRRDL